MNGDASDTGVNNYRNRLRNAHDQYWIYLDQQQDLGPYFSYELAEAMRDWKLRLFDAQLLSADFLEIINLLNAWKHRLSSWLAWNQVLTSFNNDDFAWEVRREFVEPLAYYCMHQPSSFRDALTKFATIAVHIGNINCDTTYKDELLEDREIFKRLQQEKARPYEYFLSRQKSEAQLHEKSSNWKSAISLIRFLTSLDSEVYKDSTKGWRNKSAHYIAPRFDFGDTQFVKRYVDFHEEVTSPADGGVSFFQDRSKMAVAYGFGATPSLPLSEVYFLNLQQYDSARKAMHTCEQLLQEIYDRKLSLNDYPNR
jgi:hypothetical protein